VDSSDLRGTPLESSMLTLERGQQRVPTSLKEFLESGCSSGNTACREIHCFPTSTNQLCRVADSCIANFPAISAGCLFQKNFMPQHLQLQASDRHRNMAVEGEHEVGTEICQWPCRVLLRVIPPC
jgi:hypothetical protein